RSPPPPGRWLLRAGRASPSLRAPGRTAARRRECAPTSPAPSAPWPPAPGAVPPGSPGPDRAHGATGEDCGQAFPPPAAGQTPTWMCASNTGASLIARPPSPLTLTVARTFSEVVRTAHRLLTEP